MGEIKMVTTVGGEILPKTKCRYLRGKYFKKGRVNVKGSGDCYRVTDSKGVTKYRTLETGAVVWDNSSRRYVHRTMVNSTRGIIGKGMEMGTFKKDSSNVICYDENRNKIICINEKIAKLNGFQEKLSDGYFYLKSLFGSRFFNEKLLPSPEYKQSLQYGCNNIMKKAELYYEKLYKIPKNNSYIEEIYYTNPGLFDNYTFGLEFETTRGNIPNDICNRLGLMPLRDGSISGIEYATIPLSSKKGLYTLFEILEEINKRTEYDHSCSMHIHIGGFKRDSNNALALFKSMYLNQQQIYDLFPMYKQRNMGVKRQDYTAPLPDKVRMKMSYENKNAESIKEDLFHLIYYLSGNSSGYDRLTLDEVYEHPRNPSNSRKWNMTSRYLWFNLIPLIFTNKKTVEYRIFGMPDNYKKLFFFLIMSLSLVDFTLTHKNIYLKESNRIENYGIREIFRSIFPNATLLEYLRKRMSNVRILARDRGLNFTEKHIP